MGFEFGQKGFTFGIIAIICWIVGTICNFVGVPIVGWIAGVGTIVFGIMAYIYGKKELAADANNSKAKTGKIIGLIIIILQIVGFVLSFVLVGCVACAAMNL